MAISRSDYSSEGWGRVLADRWDRLQQLVDSGQLARHPLAESWNDHSKLLRDARRAKDTGQDPGDQPSGSFDPNGNGAGLGSRNLEPTDQPGAQDDTDPTGPNSPRAPERNGASLAAHDSAEELRIRQQGVNVDNDLLLARARRSNPDRIAAMSAAVPGYSRLK